MSTSLLTDLGHSLLSQERRECILVKFRTPPFVELSGKTLIDFTSWDIFGLSSNRQIKLSAQRSIEIHGNSAHGARTISGTYNEHIDAEQSLSTFLGTESSLLFSSKNQAALSLGSALFREGDLVLIEEELQSPFFDIAFLTGADSKIVTTKDHKELLTSADMHRHGNTFLVVDLISSYSGSVNNIKLLAEFCRLHSIHLIVDLTTALGLTPTSLDPLLFANEDIICFGSLAHTLALYGGFVSGSLRLCNYLLNKSRTFLNEPAFPPFLAAAVSPALIALADSQLLREKTCATTLGLYTRLSLSGITPIGTGATPILSIQFNKFSEARECQKLLFKNGFLVQSLPSPRLHDESGIIRCIITAYHTEDHLQNFTELLQTTLT